MKHNRLPDLAKLIAEGGYFEHGLESVIMSEPVLLGKAYPVNLIRTFEQGGPSLDLSRVPDSPERRTVGNYEERIVKQQASIYERLMKAINIVRVILSASEEASNKAAIETQRLAYLEHTSQLNKNLRPRVIITHGQGMAWFSHPAIPGVSFGNVDHLFDSLKQRLH